MNTRLFSIFLAAGLFLSGCQSGSDTKTDTETKTNLVQSQEQELISIYHRMNETSISGSDSLTYYSDLFSKTLSKLLSSTPDATLTYAFSKLLAENACFITTSDDGLFRIYSWDTQLGGTMHFFEAVYQYKIGNNVHFRKVKTEEGDAGAYYTELHTLKAAHKTYYLGIANSIFSNKDVSQSIKAFSLTDKDLDETVKLMKTKEGPVNSLSLTYDFFSVVDRPERPVPVINYDPVKQVISVSNTNENDEIVDGFTTYSFNGNLFEQASSN